MDIRLAMIFILRVIALAIVLTFCFAVGGILSGLGSTAPAGSPSPDPGKTGQALLTLSLCVSGVMAYLIQRSRWHGWKLAGALFVGMYGVMTVLSQLESLVFLEHRMSRATIASIFLMGAMVSALYTPLAVLVMGKLRAPPEFAQPNLRLVMSPRAWGWKLAVIALAYTALYMGFGYYVAWRDPAVRAFYGGTDAGSFLAQLAFIWNTTPWIYPFQMGRALLWTAFTLPLIRMLRGPAWETALAMALFFSVWSTMLLLPNPYMPEAVARTHLIETFWSNLIFGALVGYLLGSVESPLPPRVRQA